MTDQDKKVYFRWGLFMRPLKKTEILLAGFVFEHHAREYGRTFPKSSRPIIRWIGEGDPPNIDGGFEAQVW